MFKYILIFYIVLIISIIYYLIGQNWVFNVVTNNFMGYMYPALIIGFTILWLGSYSNAPKKKTTIADVAFNTGFGIFSLILEIFFFPFRL